MKPVVCIVGPTASGKTALAQEVSLAIGAEVVSADSMQVYRGMDIGTGKIAPADMKVPHHGIDLVDPGEPFSAALFQEHARRRFEEITGRGNRVVLCGGTGFYVRAAIDGYEFPAGEQVGNAVRDERAAFAREHGNRALWEALRDVDPESAAIIPENDVKRVVRAFELLAGGTSYARQKEALASIPQRYPACFIGLHVEPDVLRARIDARVDEMVRNGLVDEVRLLLEKGFREGITAPQAIGYREIVEVLDGNATLEEAVESIKAATRRYAKRQRTWFRKDERIRWIDATALRIDDMTARALEIVLQS